MARGKHKDDYNEIDDIKTDLQSLRSNVVALTRHLTENGVEKIEGLEGQTKKMTHKLGVEGKRRYREVEKKVQENPGQAMLFAFCGGLLANALLRRR